MSALSIRLPCGLEAIVDAADYERVSRHSWSAYKTHRATTYAHATIDGQTVSLHRFLMGSPPMQVDHIDGDGLNNRRSNLRTATPQQSSANARIRKNNKCGVKGVYRSKSGKWVACIKVNYRSIGLGTFDSIDDAAEAYRQAAIKHFGEFARPDRAA